jgi:class 3 adenylate cyclase/ABC-type thiamine transport system ATPase subunit
VTVLFADLKGSMELLAERDPEEARELLDAVVRCMVDAVRELEGTVNQVMGDGIMALFGAPLAQEDHAVRACCAALRMQENVAHLRPELERRFGSGPSLRVGLNSGEVVVRSFTTSDVHEDYSAIGPTTHLAARMEQISEPGKILITEETWKLTRSFVHTIPRGDVPVKGLGHPVRVFELVGVTRTRLRFEASRARGLTPLVGRQAELTALRRALASAPHGQVVALVGDPGVGKSRLVWELCLTLGPDGWLVLLESAQAHARVSPYGVFRDLLRRYFGHQEDADPDLLAREVSARLEALDPALADCAPAILGLLEPARRDPYLEGLAPETRRQQTIDSLRRLLLRESHRQPVLLVVEDVQWIDPETRVVLEALVEALPAGRLTLLLTYRPEFRHDWATLSYYTQLRVLPLPPATARELLEALLGRDPALEPVIDLVLSHAEGNPFFLEERVWALVDAGALGGTRGAYRVTGPVAAVHVPATVQALLASRIDRLQPDEKALLQAAAVIGREVPRPLLRAVIGWPDARTKLVLSRLEAAPAQRLVAVWEERRRAFQGRRSWSPRQAPGEVAAAPSLGRSPWHRPGRLPR